MNIFPNEEDIKIIGYCDLNNLISSEDTILTIDYFYDFLDVFDKFEASNMNHIQRELNKKLDIILVLGSEKGEIYSLKMKEICISPGFLLENIDLLKQKKYFHRIEDVKIFFF